MVSAVDGRETRRSRFRVNASYSTATGHTAGIVRLQSGRSSRLATDSHSPIGTIRQAEQFTEKLRQQLAEKRRGFSTINGACDGIPSQIRKGAPVRLRSTAGHRRERNFSIIALAPNSITPPDVAGVRRSLPWLKSTYIAAARRSRVLPVSPGPSTRPLPTSTAFLTSPKPEQLFGTSPQTPEAGLGADPADGSPTPTFALQATTARLLAVSPSWRHWCWPSA